MITTLRHFLVKMFFIFTVPCGTSTGLMKTVRTFVTSFFETLRVVYVELVILLLHYDEPSHIKITFTEQSKSIVMP